MGFGSKGGIGRILEWDEELWMGRRADPMSKTF